MMRYVLLVPVLGLLVLLLSYTGSGRRIQAPDNLVELELIDIGIDPDNRSPVLILTDREEGKVLPVFIGVNEASSISRALGDEEMRRPMTHDLIANMIEKMGTSLVRVVIKNLEDNIYYADLVIRMGNSEVKVDCRPSDAIAIAVRLEAPVFIKREVLELAVNEELTEWWHREGMTSRLGLQLQELTDDLAGVMGAENLEGVIISSVEEGGVADENGLKRGDIVLSIDGESVGDPVEMAVVLSEMGGREVDFLILRKKEEIKIKIHVPAYGEGGENEP
jgi:bifunctional DNase/RNase